MKPAERLVSRYLVIPMVSIMMLFIVSCGSTAKVTSTGDLAGVRENNSVVAEYINYVDANNNKTPDHHYIQMALIKLADAVSAMSRAAGHTVTGDLGMSNQHANKITENANETTHSDHIRKAADILSTELQNLQRARYPGMSADADGVRSAALAIDAAVLTRNQKTPIMNFFSTSASLLRKMN